MERRKVKNGEKSSWGQCLTRPVPNGRRRCAFWLGSKTQTFSGTNQKSERRRSFGTGLVRHCPQGLFSPFFTFLRAIFFHPFRLSLAPTICPWVSEDGFHLTTETKFLQFCLFPSSSFSIAADLALFTIIHKEPLFWPYDEQLLEFFHDRVVFWGDHDAWPLPEFHSLAKKVF